MYSFIKVTTKHGEFTHTHCDYYIQDNMLTLFRREMVQERTYRGQETYYPFESHYPMENVVEIHCIKD